MRGSRGFFAKKNKRKEKFIYKCPLNYGSRRTLMNLSSKRGDRMGYYDRCQKANEVIEKVIQQHKTVSLAILTVTIRRAFGFGSTFVKRAIKDLEACGIVKVNNCNVELIENVSGQKDQRPAKGK
jgi:hypothetical protein